MNEYVVLHEYLDSLIRTKQEEYMKGTNEGGRGIEYFQICKNTMQEVMTVIKTNNYSDFIEPEFVEKFKEVLEILYSDSNGRNNILEYYLGCSKFLLKYGDRTQVEQVEVSKKFISELLLNFTNNYNILINKLNTMLSEMENVLDTYKKYREFFDENGLKRELTELEFTVLANFIKNSDLDEDICIDIIASILKDVQKKMQETRELQMLVSTVSSNATRVLDRIDEILAQDMEQLTIESDNTVEEFSENNQEQETLETSDNISEENNVTEIVFSEEERNILEKIERIIQELKEEYPEVLNLQSIFDNIISSEEFNLEKRQLIYDSNQYDKWKIILYDLLTKLKIENIQNKDNIMDIYKYIISEYEQLTQRRNITITKISEEKYDEIRQILNKVEDIRVKYEQLSKQDKNLIESIYASIESDPQFDIETITKDFDVSFVKISKNLINLLSKLKEYDDLIEGTRNWNDIELAEWAEEFGVLVAEIDAIYNNLKIEYDKMTESRETPTSTQNNGGQESDPLNILPLSSTNNYLIFLDEFLGTSYKDEDYDAVVDKDKGCLTAVAASLDRLYKLNGVDLMRSGTTEVVKGDYELTLKPRAIRNSSVRTAYIVSSISEENKKRIFEALGNELGLSSSNIKNSRIVLVLGYTIKHGDSSVYDAKFNGRIKGEDIGRKHARTQDNNIQRFEQKLMGDLTDEQILKIVSMIKNSHKYFSNIVIESQKKAQTKE